jgi:uncharacterized repeat protein (TIGR03803 family)
MGGDMIARNKKRGHGAGNLDLVRLCHGGFSASPGIRWVRHLMQATFTSERRIIMATPEHHETQIFAKIRRAAGMGPTLAMFFALTVVASLTAPAQTYTVIHNFTGGGDGADPRTGLTKDAAGNFYGTTRDGGKYGLGTVFRLALKGSTWILTPLYNFAGGNDGANADAKVIFGPDGSLYGTTAFGGGGACSGHGGQGCGTVYKLTAPATACKSAICSWTETVIYRFMGGTDGEGPGYANLIFDHAGNLYGTTQFGGSGDQGTVYELMLINGSWTESVIHRFSGPPDGYAPDSGVILDDAGNLYGTTYYGGTFGPGVVYELALSGSGWTENILYDFQGGDQGGNPTCGLIFDPSGNLYGATGKVFELMPSGGNWIYTVLYSFSSGGVYSNLIMDAAGNLYGTTFAAGAYGYGSVFKLTPSGGSWTETDLYSFSGGSDGANPQSTPVFDANGNLYGTARGGGAYGNGVVFEIAQPF